MNRSNWVAIIGLLVMSLSWGRAQLPCLNDPLQYDIMSDEIFMEAGWHFQIDGVQTDPQRITVTTTGAKFYFSPSADRVLCEQRLPRQRRSLLLRFPAGGLDELEIIAQDSGAVILQSQAGVRFKVNCDSLLMIRSQRAAPLRCRVLFQPRQTYSYGSDHLVMDAYGAVGLYSMNGVDGGQKVEGVPEYTYDLGGEGMVWCAIGPARPYPWEQSLNERLIWQGSWKSPELAVPSNELIDELKDKGTILWLQSEQMLWKTWYHQDFFPRLPDEFERVIDHSHEVGLRVMAYASPYYFVKELANPGE